MRFSFVVLTVLGAVASVSALSLFARQSSFPPCTTPCFANAKLGGCQPTDNLCLCTNTEFVQTTTACFESACTGDDLTAAESAAEAICASVGVTLGSASATSTVPVTTSTDPATTSMDPATTITDPATTTTTVDTESSSV